MSDIVPFARSNAALSGIVKFPGKSESEPDNRFCGLCGRLVGGLASSASTDFLPCVDGVDNVIECADLRRAIVQAHQVGDALGRGLHPEWAALIGRLGIPSDLIAEWCAAAKKLTEMKEAVRRGGYGMEGGVAFVRAFDNWLREGDAEAKLLALIEHGKVHLDPTAGGTKRLSMIEIGDWFETVARQAADILSDPGDWEFEGEGE